MKEQFFFAHLRKYESAHRKSYRLCEGVHLSLQIDSGLIGCGAVASFIPAVPIAVAIGSAIPVGITVIVRFAKHEEKKSYFQSRIPKF